MGLNKRGQLAIFIIVAVVIVALILIFWLYPKKGGTMTGFESAGEPKQYLSSCLESSIKDNLVLMSEQGGYDEPLGFIVYNETKVPYLCYTSEYYKTCMVQQPNIQGNFEKSLSSLMKQEVSDCLESFKEASESRGYSVTYSNPSVNFSFVPNKLNVIINTPMTIRKESSRTYNSIEFNIPTKLYDLMAISTSIIDFESTYGDSETTLYIQYYPDIKINKVKLSDGTKIYTVSNVISDDRFTFASRSLSWPAGYGLE